MELRHIRYFIKAAELLHFTHAAESLYVSQPTLSTHIHQLEEEVGLPLFDRSERNVRLTAAGKVFLERAQRAVLNLDQAKERVADLKQLTAGTLRLTALLTFGQEALPSWISTFNAVYPNIHIKVSTGTSDSIEEQILAGDADLGLSFVPPTVENLHSETLINEEIFLVVSDNHRLASRRELDLNDRAQLRHCLAQACPFESASQSIFRACQTQMPSRAHSLPNVEVCWFTVYLFGCQCGHS